jgi:Fe-S oxidoreductase
MLRALPSRCQLNPVFSRSFLTTKCQRSPKRRLDSEELKSWLRTKKDETRRRAGEVAQNAFANLALLGGKLNKISGYEDIEALKSKVTACGTLLSTFPSQINIEGSL